MSYDSRNLRRVRCHGNISFTSLLGAGVLGQTLCSLQPKLLQVQPKAFGVSKPNGHLEDLASDSLPMKLMECTALNQQLLQTVALHNDHSWAARVPPGP